MTTDILSRRVAKILPSKEGLAQLINQKKIRLYQGFDPTGGRLHLGHTVGIRKLMDFAHDGHDVIFLFGTGTVLVGDPSERDTGRKLITQEEIDTNIQGWQEQVAPIVDFDKVRILKNGDWLTQLSLKDLVRIASNISAIQLFKRDSFTRRLSRGDTVWYHETLYPLLQGYDSVAMNVDLEIGGTDQEFNMLIGRELQKKMNNRDKFVLTTPMIVGIDGQQMSKTSGNCIWLDDSANDMYGKTMSIPDNQISDYWRLLTDLPLKAEAELLANPLEHKKQLAFDIARQFHGESQALDAQKHFETTVQSKELPSEVPGIALSGSMTSLSTVSSLPLNDSRSQQKRMILQGGFEINQVKITDPNQVVEIKEGDIIRYGKRNYFKVNLNS